MRSLTHQIGNHSVNPKTRQQKGNCRECSKQVHRKALSADRSGNYLIECLCSRDHILTVVLPDNFSNRVEDIANTALRPEDDGGAADSALQIRIGLCPKGEIELGL